MLGNYSDEEKLAQQALPFPSASCRVAEVLCLLLRAHSSFCPSKRKKKNLSSSQQGGPLLEQTGCLRNSRHLNNQGSGRLIDLVWVAQLAECGTGIKSLQTGFKRVCTAFTEPHCGCDQEGGQRVFFFQLICRKQKLRSW